MIRLVAVLDGVSLGEEEARALWARFSAYMEEHRGDLSGFAQSEGFASVHPETRSGQAVLIVSRTEPQRPYGAKRSSSGSRPGSQGAHFAGGAGSKAEKRSPKRRG